MSIGHRDALLLFRTLCKVSIFLKKLVVNCCGFLDSFLILVFADGHEGGQ